MPFAIRRVRSQSRQEIANMTADYYNKVNGKLVLTAWNREARVMRATRDTMEDQVTPSGRGRYPDRPCHHTKVMVEWDITKDYLVSHGNSARRGSAAPLWGRDPCGSTRGLGQASWDSTGIPDIKSALLESVDPARLALAGLPFLGELRATCQMIRKPFSFLARLPKGQRSTPLGQHLRNLGLGPTSNGWLQYQYGWKPLMGDLASVAAMCGSFGSDYHDYLNGFPSNRSLSRSSEYATSSQEWIEGDYSRHIVSCSKTARYDCVYGIKPAHETSDALSKPAFLAAKLGLTLPDIASTVWELTPYSFVADWFLPIGRLLSEMRRTPTRFEIVRENYHDTWRYTHQEYWKFDGLINYEFPEFPSDFKTCSLTETGTEYWRNWADHGPQPDFLGTGMSTPRTLSALSLIAQRLMMPIPR